MENSYHKVFEKMIEKKYPEVHKKIHKKYRIFVTTCGTASNKSVLSRFKFTRVLVDEATMVKECDLFLSTRNAQQLVMIGDQKQLGPTFEYNFKGNRSLFTRLLSNPNAKFDTLEI